MKKLTLLLALCTAGFGLSAQNSYGSHKYGHSNSRCTAGGLGLNNPGFMLAGVNTNLNASPYTFDIDRTDLNGVISSATYVFQKEYKLYDCSSNLIQLRDVRVVETTNNTYVVTGLGGGGIFFAELSSTGAVNAQKFYPFPAGSTAFTRPIITESFAHVNEYFIVGSYSGIMYMMRVNNTGGIMAQMVSDLTSSGYRFIPTAIIESPYTTQDLVIVGQESDNTGNGGFYYQVDNNLSAAGFNTNFFYHGPAAQHSSFFTSIALSNSNVGGNPGFLIGGQSQSPSGLVSQSWITRFDQAGNMLWSSIVQGSIDNNSFSVVGITERFSAFYGSYENYSIASSNSGIVVFNLEENGKPNSFVNPGTTDEANYNIGAFPPSNTTPIAITNNNNGALQDEGLHIYGAVAGNGAHYLAESYFSGETGCNVVNSINSYDNNMPNSVSYTDYNPSMPWSPCNNNLTANANGASGPICNPQPSLPAPATNNRLAAATGIAKNTSSSFEVYPNPTKDKIYISTGNATSGNISIKLTDVLGRTITVADKTDLGAGLIEINLEKLGLAKGVYTMQTTYNGKVTQQKIIYSAE